MASASRSIGRRLIVGTLGGAAIGALLSAVLALYPLLTGSMLASVPFLAVTGCGALAGFGAAGGFMLARPTHSHRAWRWWALALGLLSLFYGALLSAIIIPQGGLAARAGAIAPVAVLALALASAALLIGHSLALMSSRGTLGRSTFAVAAGVVCGCAAGLGFGLASLVTLRPCQPHQYCLEPDPARILQADLLTGAILGLLLGVAVALALALAASAAQRADADFHTPHTNGVAGA